MVTILENKLHIGIALPAIHDNAVRQGNFSLLRNGAVFVNGGSSMRAQEPSMLRLELGNQFGHNLMHVADKGKMGYLQNRRVGIAVDGHDNIGLLHACQMLDCAGYAAGNVEARLNGFAGLANLMVMLNPAKINRGARSTDLPASSPANSASIRKFSGPCSPRPPDTITGAFSSCTPLPGFAIVFKTCTQSSPESGRASTATT